MQQRDEGLGLKKSDLRGSKKRTKTTSGSVSPKRRELIKLLGATGVGTTLATGRVAALLSDDGDGDGSEDDYFALPFETTAPDGTTLRGHVHVREDAETPMPVVLVLSPYWNETGTSSEDALEDAINGPLMQRLVDEGYAVAAVSMRGTGDSEGCLDYFGSNDQMDATHVVDALAEEPYSNGRVGMVGFSFDGGGISAALAGKEPDALEAIVPIDTTHDLYRMLVFNGVPWTLGIPQSSTLGGEANAVGTRPLALTDRLDCDGRTENLANFIEGYESGSKTGWFEARDLTDAVVDSDVPMFLVNGLKPLRFSEQFVDAMTGEEGEGTAHIEQFRGVFGERAGPTRMLLGQWGHQYPYTDDFHDQVVTWFEHYLHETHPGESGTAPGQQPDGVETGVVEYEDDSGNWHTADSWPPTSETETLHLSNESLVKDGSEVEVSDQTFQSVDTMPGLDEVNCGPTQAVYVSDPLDEDVRFAGTPKFTFTLESTLDGGNLVAELLHTPYDGSCPDDDAERFGRLNADLRHWFEIGDPRPFPTGEPTEVTFEGHPLAAHVPEGHRIVLVVSGGCDTLVPDERKPLLTIHTGCDHESSINLPVSDGELRFSEVNGDE